MELNRSLEQQIAVFGESGSGKTVLISAFYGGTQEPHFLKSSLFDVTADNTGQGHQLHRNYLGMRDSGLPPGPTKFASTSYAFTIKLRQKATLAKSSQPFDALRLIWHDYPGEWFEQEVSGAEESQRRVDTFKSLLGSDVALLLVDGQRLLDNAGEEERYLKALLGSFRTGLLRMRDELLEDGKPLVQFPRIWVLALSKADLLPGLDVFGLRDLVVAKASDDLEELRRVLAGLVDSSDALAVGEDFLLLSSARFEDGRIEVSERVGLDYLLPLSAMLPFERHVRWVEEKRAGAKVVEDLVAGLGPLAVALIGKAKFAGPIGKVLALLNKDGVNKAITVAAQLVGSRLVQMNADAMAKHDHMAAVLSRFRLDLDEAEERNILLRSKK